MDTDETAVTPEMIDRALDVWQDAERAWRYKHDSHTRYAVLDAARTYVHRLLDLAVRENVITEARAEFLRRIS